MSHAIVREPLTAAQKALASDPRLLRLARILAARKSAGLPRMRDEFLSAAYWGLADAARLFDPGAGMSFKNYAWVRILGSLSDAARHDTPKGFRRPGRHGRAVPAVHTGYDREDTGGSIYDADSNFGDLGGWVAQVPARPETPDPARRQLAAWCDTRADRIGMGLPFAQRVRLYLWLVEGWSYAEVGAALGCSLTAVAMGFARWVPGWSGLDVRAVTHARSSGTVRAKSRLVRGIA